MNFLAHTFLSFTDEQIVGNMIGDFIKNKNRQNLSEEIQQGITLHRAIDAFTDLHPKVLEAKTVFQPIVRLYSGAFVDVVFVMVVFFVIVWRSIGVDGGNID